MVDVSSMGLDELSETQSKQEFNRKVLSTVGFELSDWKANEYYPVYHGN